MRWVKTIYRGIRVLPSRNFGAFLQAPNIAGPSLEDYDSSRYRSLHGRSHQPGPAGGYGGLHPQSLNLK